MVVINVAIAILNETVLTSPQNLILSKNKKKNVYQCKSQYYYIYKGGSRGGLNYIGALASCSKTTFN